MKQILPIQQNIGKKQNTNTKNEEEGQIKNKNGTVDF